AQGLIQQGVAPTTAQGLAAQWQPSLFTALKYSLTSGLQTVFLVAFVLMCIAFVVCIFLKEIPLRKAGGSAGMASLAEGGHVSGEEALAEVARNGHEVLDMRPLLATEDRRLAAVEDERGTPETIGPPLG